MLWPLLNRLFGWDYVHCQNTATEIVLRVKRTRSGERYVVYFQGRLVFIDRPDCHWQVSELTQPPSKTAAFYVYPGGETVTLTAHRATWQRP